jgi:chromate transporter
MKDDPFWPLVRAFAAISMISIGGATSVTPEIHRRVVEQTHWMDNATFANLFAISQAAPGPNFLIVSLVGWQVDGAAGLIATTLAALIPSCLLAFFVGRMLKRVSAAPWFAVLQDALVPITIGLVAASGVVLARAAVGGVILALVAAAATALVVFTNRSPLWSFVFGMLVAAGACALRVAL